MDDYSHLRPGAAGTAGAHKGAIKGTVWPTCDDVLDSAVLALIHGPVVFGLPLTQLCYQLMLLLSLLMGLNLNREQEN